MASPARTTSGGWPNSRRRSPRPISWPRTISSSSIPAARPGPPRAPSIMTASGPAGPPKGAFYQHRQPPPHAPVPVLGYDMRHDSRILLVYPHNSIASLNVVYVPAWMLGATVVLTDVRQFSAERWLDTVVREKVTHCHLVPTMLFRVLEHPKVRE